MSIIREALVKAQDHADGALDAARSAAENQPARTQAVNEGGAGPSPAHPKRDLRAAILLVVIFAVLTLVAAGNIFDPGRQRRGPARSAPRPSTAREFARQTSAGAGPVAGAAGALQGAIFLDSPLLRPKYVLNGIMYLEGSPRAIVNDETVVVGDFVRDAIVLKIDERKVVLLDDEEEVTLTLK